MSILDEIKVNRTPTHMVRSPSLTLSREARQSMGKYTEREKQPGEAPAPENNLWQRGKYKTGDGDYTAQVPREGSLRAFSLPSRGHRT
mgnify:CR=1 FL=1|tara:strand:+ start:76 stop:339 length:264 start_codon:yes stop_codon:yes gene_type:complete